MSVYGKIYKLTNKLNGLSYVGQTTKPDVMQRVRQHFEESRSNRHITNVLRKYGQENFSVEVLFEAFSKDALNFAEAELVEKLNTMYPNGYNHRAGGFQNGICSEELKRKISAAKRGKPNFKKRGEPRSETYRKKISIGLGGKSIKATFLSTGESFILQTAHEGRKFGFNPSNIVAICKKHGRRFSEKGYTFEYVEENNMPIRPEVSGVKS